MLLVACQCSRVVGVVVVCITGGFSGGVGGADVVVTSSVGVDAGGDSVVVGVVDDDGVGDVDGVGGVDVSAVVVAGCYGC